MRNKFKTRKSTARPTRFTGNGGGGDAYGDPLRGHNPALSSPPRTPPEKALIETEERFSMSMFDRPSMMSDRSGRFEQMSFELPRR